jgi:hypothetical protein
MLSAIYLMVNSLLSGGTWLFIDASADSCLILCVLGRPKDKYCLLCYYIKFVMKADRD